MPRMPVAVKVLRSRGAHLGDELVAEANTMAELAEHPNIASILSAGVTADDWPYLVMG
ncbi:protein tyrosine kinase [Knoellia remsis]|uniref:Protein tyrosine kinase n=1 Tax=Knoellia remsis TaxID=407159 RepID=A0A2T0TUL8_9MICO|nr:protein tyrosine kinase [Knoellia remsis]